ncbi:MAG TPA: beta-galactosidase [Planctomycetota bacterium]|nr:beta-galactosidase [Planctomycetota bacterium]
MKNYLTARALALTLSLFFSYPLLGAESALIEFGANFDRANLTFVDSTATAGSNLLRIETHHKEAWPGVTLKAPHEKWDLSGVNWIRAAVKNTGSSDVTVYWRLDNPGADGTKHCITKSIALKAAQSGAIEVTFKHPVANFVPVKLFGMRGYPAEMPADNAAFDSAAVTQMLFFVTRPKEIHSFEIGSIVTGGSAPKLDTSSPAKPFLPFIDTFGQYIHRDWPGKTHSLAELEKNRDSETKDLAAHAGPASWDQYGGYKDGPALEAAGFFRTQKIDGKWWLVDPEGRLFWSHGIDCVNTHAATPTEDREGWFQNFPGDLPEFKAFIEKGQYALHGYYKGRHVTAFNFYSANLKRKFGDNWLVAFRDEAHARLRSWNMNTIGNWSDPAVCKLRRTPYVGTIHSGGKFLEGSEGYWGQFHDVFDPSFRESIAKNVAQQKSDSAQGLGAIGDPWCLGFFIDNEIAWGDDISLAVATLRSPATQAAKKVFVDDLTAEYTDIAKLNAAWGSHYESWQALLAERTPPDAKNKAVRADLEVFYTKFAEQYFKICRDELKAAAPKQLYLGCRFAWVNDRAAKAAAKYCDVISYNLYRRSIADFKFPGGTEVPLMVGEWHLGALDRGMFHEGLVPVKDQNERAKIYRDYVSGALRHPQFVGCHWFQFADEATTGRTYDEENYQIGFVDTVDTPYAETIAAARDVGAQMYSIRLGK